MENNKDYSKVFYVIAVIMAVVLAAGLIISVVDNASDDIGGIVGSTTTGTTATTATTNDVQAACEHVYSGGVCTKCGVNCGHISSAAATNGNFYCTACAQLTKLKTPVLSNKNSQIVWDAIDDSMVYYVYMNGASDLTANSYYDYVIYEAGTYTFQVQAFNRTANVYSEMSEMLTLHYYTFTVDEYDNGDIMGVGDWEDETPLEPVLHGGSWSGQIYPKMGYELPSTVYITMNGALLTSGYTYDATTGVIIIDSVTSNFHITYDSGLERPAAPAVTLSGNVVSWNKVTKADNYAVNIVGDGFNEWYDTTSTSFTVDMLSIIGDYTISVWSEASGVRSVTCGSVTYSFKDGKLETPVLTKSGSIVSWNTVANATHYVVYAKNTAGDIVSVASGLTATSLDLSVYENKLKTIGAGPYTVYVMAFSDAHSDGSFYESGESNTVSYTLSSKILTAPTLTAGYTNGKLTHMTWASIAGADNYLVYCTGSNGSGVLCQVNADGSGEYLITFSAYAESMENYGDGPYSITVVARGNGFTNSAASGAIRYEFEKLDTPVITLSGNMLSWTPVDGAAGYYVYATSADGSFGLISDGTTGTSEDLSAYSARFADLGTGPYSVQLLACPTEVGVANSNYSNSVSYSLTYHRIRMQLVNKGTGSNVDYYLEFEEPWYDPDYYYLTFEDANDSTIFWSAKLSPTGTGIVSAHLTGVDIMSLAEFTTGDVICYVTAYYTVDGVEKSREGYDLEFNLNDVGAN